MEIVFATALVMTVFAGISATSYDAIDDDCGKISHDDIRALTAVNADVSNFTLEYKIPIGDVMVYDVDVGDTDGDGMNEIVAIANNYENVHSVHVFEYNGTEFVEV